LIITEIVNRNWIYIGSGRKVEPSLNDMNSGADMNAYTATSPRIETRGTFARLLRTLRIELRRAIELAGAPYKDGVLPPL
jgi:hypothetical protein